MYVFSDIAKHYDIEGMDEVVNGDTKVMISGTSVPFLFTEKIKKKHLSMKSESYFENVNYDPIVWQIAFHKDGTLCKMLTNKGDYRGDIQDIEQLAERKLKGSEIKKFDLKHVYNNFAVDNPARFTLGRETLYDIITSAIHVDNNKSNEAVPIVINMLIDKEGQAHIDGFLKKRNAGK